MKTTTLKLTKDEWNILYNNLHIDRCFMGITLPLDDEFGCFVDVHNVDNFRGSLNDEIDKIYSSDDFIGGVTMNEKYSFYHYQEKIDGDVDAMKRKLNNLKSILNKIN
jgi:hypothetical protein